MPTWSFSRLLAYEQCPMKWKLHLEGVKEEENEYSIKGNHYHKICEDAVKLGVDHPDIPESWKPIIAKGRSDLLAIEQLWGLNTVWAPDKEKPWCWVKLDLCVKEGNGVVVYDYKSGKKKPVPHAMQANLYLIAAAAYYSDAEYYRSEFHYINDQPLVTRNYDHCTIDLFKASFERRAEKMLNDTELRPRPSAKGCQYCGYKSNCKYNASE